MRPELRLPVAAAGSLNLQAPGGSRVRIIATGGEVSAEFANLTDLAKAVLDLQRGRGGGNRSLRRAAANINRLGAVTGMTFCVSARGRQILEMGSAVRPGWLARIFRLGGVSIHVRNLLAAALGFTRVVDFPG